MNVVVPPNAAAREPSTADWARMASVTLRSKWTWASMPPGTTNLPKASSVSRASPVIDPGAESPAILPSLTPISARTGVCPVTTVPPTTTRSSIRPPHYVVRRLPLSGEATGPDSRPQPPVGRDPARLPVLGTQRSEVQPGPQAGAERWRAAGSSQVRQPDELLGGAVEGAAVEATEELVDGEASRLDQAQDLVGMAEVHVEQPVAALEHQPALVQHLGHPAPVGHLGDRIEAGVLPEDDPLAGIRMAHLASEAVVVLPRGDQLRVGHEHVAGEAAARRQVRPHRGQGRQPVVVAREVEERAERDGDQWEAPLEADCPHVAPVQLDAVAETGRGHRRRGAGQH